MKPDTRSDTKKSPGLVLLTWCAPWLIALPITSVRRIISREELADDAGQELPLELAELLGLERAPGAPAPGAWVVVDRQTPVALGVDRCLQVVDPSTPVRRVPRSLLRSSLELACFPVLRPITGLTETPPVALWLDPARLPLGQRPAYAGASP